MNKFMGCQGPPSLQHSEDLGQSRGPEKTLPRLVRSSSTQDWFSSFRRGGHELATMASLSVAFQSLSTEDKRISRRRFPSLSSRTTCSLSV